MAALADDMGLAKSTVSRALRGSRQVSKETIERVRKRADELGYSVHPHVRTLMSCQRRQKLSSALEVIAFVNDYDTKEEFFENPLMKAVFLAATEQASEMGCALEWIPLKKSDVGGESLRRELTARGISGIILAPLREIGLSPLLWMQDFALLGCGNYWATESVDEVRTDGRDGYLKLISAMERNGCRKVGIYFPPRLRMSIRQVGSIFENLRCWGSVTLTDLGVSLPNPDAMLVQIERELLDGVIFHGAENARSALDFYEAYPNKVVLAEYSPRDIYGTPKWLTTVSPLEQIGRTLSKIIIEKIARSELGFTSRPQITVMLSSLSTQGTP